jgi:hypothetical protein
MLALTNNFTSNVPFKRGGVIGHWKELPYDVSQRANLPR